MRLSSKTKILFLLIGDIATLYTALLLALVLRYGSEFYAQFARAHLAPFSLIFPMWLLVFYAAGLYDLPRLRNNLDFIKTLLLTLFVNAFLTIAIFYLVPAVGIAPKTNLFIFIFLFAVLEVWWRRTFNIRASFREGLNRVLLLGEGATAAHIARTLEESPQIGYEIKVRLKGGVADPEISNLQTLARRHAINLIVIPSELKHDAVLMKAFYELLASGVPIIDLPSFYELVFRKIPLHDIEETWFLEHNIGHKKFYDELKRGIELLAALLLLLALLPLEIAIALFVRLTSPGPAIYAQRRIGERGREFILYKFRTMVQNAEREGVKWAERKDKRVTLVGRFLRYTHLDELPQLWNILEGTLSFVGPRPERPEFTATLSGQIPFYRTRHLVKPGITGWAQVNFRYGASIDDAKEKLAYDIYYLKNRSLILDIAIIVKTLKSFFVNHA